MKKAIIVRLTVLLFVIAVSVISTISVPLSVSLAAGPTYVFDDIASDTTWTAANSPYIVNNSVRVLTGCNLTIEPNVTVKFNSAKGMQIDGQLIAQGNATARILFTSNQSSHTSGYWVNILFTNTSVDATYYGNGSYQNGSIMQYCTIEYGGGSSIPMLKIMSASPFIDHCVVTRSAHGGIYVDSGSPKISNCTISNNSVTGSGGGIAASGTVNISNCTVSNNSVIGSGGGIAASGTVNISNCTVSNNSASDGGGGIIASEAVTINNSTISSNLASNSGGGICTSDTVTISNSTISSNVAASGGGGIHVNSGEPLINHNNIYSNTLFDVYNANAQGSPDVNATNNWWGTNNSTVIEAHIYDFSDNFALGVVDYSPYRDSGPTPPPTPTLTPTSAPTATETPTPTPTTTPTPTPTATATSTPTPTPYPPDAPNLSSPVNGSNCASINTTLRWTASWSSYNAPTSFQVYLSNNSSTLTQVGSPNASTFYWELQNLSYNATYYWKVAANNSYGNTSGPILHFTTERFLGAPITPSPVNGSTGVSVNVTLNWADCANASSYYVCYDTSLLPNYCVSTNNSSYQLTQLPYGATFYWRVGAIGNCSSNESNLWRFTTVSAPAPTPVVKVNIGGSNASYNVNDIGVLQQAVNLSSADNKVTVNIPAGTTALNRYGEPLDEIDMIATNVSPAPDDGRFVVAAFDFGPDHATFHPGITITLKYDPAMIPSGQNEADLVIAFYNEITDKWEYINNGVVDSSANTITFTVGHFTIFTIQTPASSGSGIWVIVTIIVAAVVVLGLLAVLLYSRYRRTHVSLYYEDEEEGYNTYGEDTSPTQKGLNAKGNRQTQPSSKDNW